MPGTRGAKGTETPETPGGGEDWDALLAGKGAANFSGAEGHTPGVIQKNIKGKGMREKGFTRT
jgi:hypothetical protein